MPSSDEILDRWTGMAPDADFQQTVQKAFDLPLDDDYVYTAESFAMPLGQIQDLIRTGNLTWTYSTHERVLEVPETDITAYTAIFASTTDTAKALTSFAANAKKGSPRQEVAHHLLAKRRLPTTIKSSKLKKPHLNPYFDVWAWSCRATRFVGPLGEETGYADPAKSKMTHPMLPVLYHHFGCVCPSYEALSMIGQLVAGTAADGVVDMASGSGYWTYLLRRLGIAVTAVDNMDASWRTMWIEDTIKADGVDYLKRQGGVKNQILLMIYMVTRGAFTRHVLRTYKGDTIVVVGTQNTNKYTTFSDVTVEEYFEREQNDFELSVRIALPSFAGKDEAMFVFQRKR
ncbi:MAG: hypothetical protein M1818_003395 [Claussenomyces sp. TS43310]|nr:MAG: hypothetical protein M1818_003395 [Claussenomyces sp. TS43310]